MVKAKLFDELTPRELYELLKARAQTFVVEMDCAYLDMDDVDYRSLHVFFEENGVVTAYLRAFYLDGTTVKIGRVLTREHGRGHGRALMEAGLNAIRERLHPERIVMDSQQHAVGFYKKFGFKVTSDVFCEVGIPHVKMELP